MITSAQAAIPSHWPQPRMLCTSAAPGIPDDDGFDPATGSDVSANAGVAANMTAAATGAAATARIRVFRDIADTSGWAWNPPGGGPPPGERALPDANRPKESQTFWDGP